jgi:hypothetical protein
MLGEPKMTKEFKYNAKRVFTDDETHKAVVSHFDKIEKEGTDKRFEWEDEEIPEEHFGITSDFNEWNERVLSLYLSQSDYNAGMEIETDVVNQLKPYIDGFLLQNETYGGIGLARFLAQGHTKARVQKAPQNLQRSHQLRQVQGGKGRCLRRVCSTDGTISLKLTSAAVIKEHGSYFCCILTHSRHTTDELLTALSWAGRFDAGKRRCRRQVRGAYGAAASPPSTKEARAAIDQRAARGQPAHGGPDQGPQCAAGADDEQYIHHHRAKSCLVSEAEGATLDERV